MILLLIYWVLSTIYGIYWLIKHPSKRHGDDITEFTLFDIVAYVFPSGLLAWVFVPMMVLHSIKFKR